MYKSNWYWGNKSHFNGISYYFYYYFLWSGLKWNSVENSRTKSTDDVFEFFWIFRLWIKAIFFQKFIENEEKSQAEPKIVIYANDSPKLILLRYWDWHWNFLESSKKFPSLCANLAEIWCVQCLSFIKNSMKKYWRTFPFDSPPNPPLPIESCPKTSFFNSITKKNQENKKFM